MDEKMKQTWKGMGVVLGLTLMASPAGAAEWYTLPTSSVASPLAAPTVTTGAAPGTAHLDALRDRLELHGVKLVPFSVLPVAGSELRVHRYTQTYRDLEVVGTTVALLMRENGTIETAVVEVERGLDMSMEPALGEAEAKRIIESDAEGLSTAWARPGVLVVQNRRLAWRVDVPTIEGGVRFVVDAETGEIMMRRELGMDVLGRVFERNPVVTPETSDVELTHLDLGEPQFLKGWEGMLDVTNYVSGDPNQGSFEMMQNVMPVEGTSDFLYDPPSDPTDANDSFAQVSVYYHLTRMRSYFEETLELDMSDNRWQLTAVANLTFEGQPLDNAYFSPMGVVFTSFDAPNLIGIGQGENLDFAVDADVFLHEFTHYVTHNAIGYNLGEYHYTEMGPSPFSGAIDEGISDYFSSTVNGDPVVAETALAAFDMARDLTDTSLSCPSDMVGQVHDDGRLIGSAAWALRDAMGAETADMLIWGGTALMPAGGTFGDWARGVRAVALGLTADDTFSPEDVALVESTLNAQGLLECDQAIPLHKGQPRSLLIGGHEFAMWRGRTCADQRDRGRTRFGLFQFELTPEPTDTGLELRVSFARQPQIDQGDDLLWRLVVRADTPISYTPDRWRLVLGEHDFATELTTEHEMVLVLDETSNIPFNPNTTYYVTVEGQNCITNRATFEVSALETEPVVVDEGVLEDIIAEPAGEDTATAGADAGSVAEVGTESVVRGGDCSCQVASTERSHGPLGGLLALGLGVLVMWRRRA